MVVPALLATAVLALAVSPARAFEFRVDPKTGSPMVRPSDAGASWEELQKLCGGILSKKKFDAKEGDLEEAFALDSYLAEDYRKHFSKDEPSKNPCVRSIQSAWERRLRETAAKGASPLERERKEEDSPVARANAFLARLGEKGLPEHLFAPDDGKEGGGVAPVPAPKPIPKEDEGKKKVADAIVNVKSPDADLRRDAAWDLIVHGGPEHNEVLYGLLTDKNEWVRGAAIYAMGSRRYKKAIPHLAKLMDFPGPHQLDAAKALFSLESVEHAGKVYEIILPAIDDTPVPGGFGGMDRTLMMKRIRNARGPFVDKLAEYAVRDLESTDETRRRLSTEFLIAYGDKKNASAVAKLLKSSSDTEVQSTLLALGALQSKDHAKEIETILNDIKRPEHVRRSALQALHMMEMKAETAQEIAGLIGKRDAHARVSALRLIQLQKSDGSFPRGTFNSGDRAVTALTMKALSKILEDPRRYNLSKGEIDAIAKTIERGDEYLRSWKDNGYEAKFDPFQTGYRLSRMAQSGADKAEMEKIVRGIEGAILANGAVENTAYSATFQTAVVLNGLTDAAGAGLPEAKPAMRRIIAALEKERQSNGYFGYYHARSDKPPSVEGAFARSVVNETALLRAYEALGMKEKAEVSRKNLVENLLPEYKKRVGTLERVALEMQGRAEPHSGPSQIANYYYLFSLMYAAESASRLDPDSKREFQTRLERGIVLARDPRSQYWLDREGKAYGTAMSLYVLANGDAPEGVKPPTRLPVQAKPKAEGAPGLLLPPPRIQPPKPSEPIMPPEPMAGIKFPEIKTIGKALTDAFKNWIK